MCYLRYCPRICLRDLKMQLVFSVGVDRTWVEVKPLSSQLQSWSVLHITIKVVCYC
jgi:hypothetical protein